MIKSNELRIGNIISWRTGLGGLVIGVAHEVHVDKVAISKAVNDGEEGGQGFMGIAGLDPIPLTPEWLGRMGFEYEEKTGDTYASWYGHNGHIQIDKTEDGFKWVHGEDFRHDFISIEYVHQLQNLYFALAGEELTIKN